MNNKIPVPSEYDITDEVCNRFREDFNSREQIEEDLRWGMCWIGGVNPKLDTLKWGDNPVFVSCRFDLDLLLFMKCRKLDRKYRLLAEAIRRHMIDQFYDGLEIDLYDSYSEAIISPARVTLMQDIADYYMIIDHDKRNKLIAQVDAINKLFVAAIDEVRDKLGTRITRFDHDAVVRKYIINNKEMHVWMENLTS